MSRLACVRPDEGVQALRTFAVFSEAHCLRVCVCVVSMLLRFAALTACFKIKKKNLFPRLAQREKELKTHQNCFGVFSGSFSQRSNRRKDRRRNTSSDSKRSKTQLHTQHTHTHTHTSSSLRKSVARPDCRIDAAPLARELASRCVCDMGFSWCVMCGLVRAVACFA
jgi:hypothetical protein